ncbi:hypothetical protein NMS_0956 [Nonlabens marinus S1-08]|uniref:Uncharacterized protein n=1 Tax=Nonlabens marinus S1-08 TaxID=1454201 RepID=W8VQA2_9FLAO|nr:hypothetical protein NMS_0956 [Nonlabens marinus S1-08]
MKPQYVIDMLRFFMLKRVVIFNSIALLSVSDIKQPLS